MNPSRWWRDSRFRRRLVLGFYAVLLLAVAGAVLAEVADVMSSQRASLPDRLAETSDWLAGGTLALAAVAGLVALQAYASATGPPRLLINVRFTGQNDFFVELPTDARQITPTTIKGPICVAITLSNMSSYSARNPAVVVWFFGAHPWSEDSAIGEGWTITSGSPSSIQAVQWDGGPIYSIHGRSVRRLRFELGGIYFPEDFPPPLLRLELLAEGYRREVFVPVPLPYIRGEDVGWMRVDDPQWT